MIIPQFLVNEIRLSNFFDVNGVLGDGLGPAGRVQMGAGFGLRVLFVEGEGVGEAGSQVIYSILMWVVEFGELFG